MAKDRVQSILDTGWELREEYADVLKRRAANRRSLRDLATQGVLDEAEAAQVLELYPPRGEGEETTEAAA